MPQAAFGPDAPAVTLDDVARNRQPQASTGLSARTVHLVESFENARQVFGRDAGAGIRH